MATIATPANPASAQVWTGRVLSGLAAAFLLMDAGMKLAVPGLAAANSPDIGWPLDTGTLRTLGVLLLIPTLLYIWPRTALLGAILITGYLGGVIATHMRVGNPLLTHTLFGVYLALLIWGGLWLRDTTLRSILPFTREKV